MSGKGWAPIPVTEIPRWQFMTDEARALTGPCAVSGLTVLALLPWAMVDLIAWWIWKAISKSVRRPP